VGEEEVVGKEENEEKEEETAWRPETSVRRGVEEKASKGEMAWTLGTTVRPEEEEEDEEEEEEQEKKAEEPVWMSGTSLRSACRPCDPVW
jgi:hypothetical protein